MCELNAGLNECYVRQETANNAAVGAGNVQATPFQSLRNHYQFNYTQVIGLK